VTQARIEAPTTSLSSLDRHGRGLRVDFQRVGDQYAHRIVGLGSDGSSAAIIESVEGESTLPWPSSPALQELNIENLGSSPVAMLIGKAGDGHWSLSIELLNDGEAPGLLLDAACRVKSLPANLTSTYRVAELVKTVKSGSSLHLTTHTGAYRLESAPLGESASCKSCQTVFDKDTLKLKCATARTDSLPVTLRWRYAIRLAPESMGLETA